MNNCVIFYLPKDMRANYNSQSGTNLRPLEMQKAFIKKDYEVLLVSGSIKERKKQTAEILKSLDPNIHYVLYVESANIPLALSNYRHWPIDLGGDLWNFYRLSRRMNTGFYYRDIHWKYKNYYKTAGVLKGLLLKSLYLFEYLFLAMVFDYIFTPSKAFQSLLPNCIRKAKYEELPPGCLNVANSIYEYPTGSLRLYYSGNINPISTYNLSGMFSFIAKNNHIIKMTVNTNRQYYEQYIDFYKQEQSLDGINFTFSEYGEVSNEKYNIAIMLWGLDQRNEITSIGMPIKLFHYLSLGLPVLTDKHTPYGDVIEENNLGWVVESYKELEQKLIYLQLNTQEVEICHQNTIAFAKKNRWEDRVTRVEELFENL